MSINEIVNYVNRTPHNTNPNVIASMVRGANEQAVYESVEKLKQDGGVGYIESAKVIGSVHLNNVLEGTGTVFEESVPINTFQALKEGETYVVKTDSGTFERVCDVIIDGIDTISIIGNPKMFTDEDNGDSFFVATTTINVDTPGFIGIIAADFNFGSHIMVSKAETVHTIDPKYLPYGGLPYIELSFVNNSFTTKPVGWHDTTRETTDKIEGIVKSRPPAFLARLPHPTYPIIVLFTYRGEEISYYDNAEHPLYCGQYLWNGGNHAYLDLMFDPNYFGEYLWGLGYKVFSYQSA